MNTPIILDADTGEDDALAILVAVMAKLPLTHVVSTYGNTTLAHATRNTADVLHLAKATSVQVVKGASSPQSKHPFISSNALAGAFVGKNGLCNITMPANTSVTVVSPPENTFSTTMEEIFKKNGRSHYIAIGPQTNLAKLCRDLKNTIHEYIDTVYIMGGAFNVPGNSGPLDKETGQPPSEFNIWCDPIAAAEVLRSGLKLRYVSWDVCKEATIPYSQTLSFSSPTPEGQFAIQLMHAFLETYGLKNNIDFELSDPLTIFAAMGYGTYKPMRVSVITEGQKYGKMYEDPNGEQIEFFTLNNPGSVIKEMLRILTIH